MENKEFRLKIYKWLYEEFKIRTSSLKNEQKRKLKNILENFNPTQPIITQKPKVAIKRESVWKSYPKTK